MLGSITPLGERGRGRVWKRTVAALVVGGAAGGATLGLFAGGIAAAVHLDQVGSEQRLAALGVVLAIAVVLDLRGALPTVHRQVNEDWLYVFRDWVYGAGFGFQLGAGVATIVTTAGVYATFAAALLVGSVPLALALGVVFGVVRTATVLLGASVRTPADAAKLDALVQAWAARAQVVTVALLGALSVTSVAQGAV